MPIHIKGSGGGKASPVGFGFTDYYTESDSKFTFPDNYNYVTFKPKDALSVVDLSQITGVENISICIEEFTDDPYRNEQDCWQRLLFTYSEGNVRCVCGEWYAVEDPRSENADKYIHIDPCTTVYNKDTGELKIESDVFESFSLDGGFTMRASVTWKIG